MAYEWNPFFQYLKRENAVEYLMKSLRRGKKSVRGKEDDKIITNADRIRSMTDEKLAKFLAEEENLVCILCRDESFDCCRCCKEQREKVYTQWLLKLARDPWEAYDEEIGYD